jgi:hypothetical protein
LKIQAFKTYLLATVLFCTYQTHADGFIIGFDIPLIDDSPETDKKLDINSFEKISQVLHASRMAPHLDCAIKTKNSKQERKFISETKYVEVLEVEYMPRNLFSPKKINFKIPADLANFGSKISPNQWSGSGEDIKIEMNDYYNHWLRFTHDGRGQIIQFNVGNSSGTYPCSLK